MTLKMRVYSPFFTALVSLAGMGLAPTGLHADTLAYGINSGVLGTVDLNTGAFTKIGPAFNSDGREKLSKYPLLNAYSVWH